MDKSQGPVTQWKYQQTKNQQGFDHSVRVETEEGLNEATV